MPEGSGRERVFVVFGADYTMRGIAPTENAAFKYFTGEEPVRVVGPIYFNEQIEWDKLEEVEFGVDHGGTKEYNEVNDGVPIIADKGYVSNPADRRYRASLRKV